MRIKQKCLSSLGLPNKNNLLNEWRPLHKKTYITNKHKRKIFLIIHHKTFWSTVTAGRDHCFRTCLSPLLKSSKTKQRKQCSPLARLWVRPSGSLMTPVLFSLLLQICWQICKVLNNMVCSCLKLCRQAKFLYINIWKLCFINCSQGTSSLVVVVDLLTNVLHFDTEKKVRHSASTAGQFF